MPDMLVLCHSYGTITIHTFPQVRAFMQLGKTSGKSSISIAVDVTTNLMIMKGITPKFTLDELRDNITQYNCGTRGQSRKFHQLDRELNWHGSTISLKVPVVQLNVFPEDTQQALVSILSTNSSLVSGTSSGALSLPGTTSPEIHPPATGTNCPPTETDPLATGTNHPPTETDPLATGTNHPPTETDPPATRIDCPPTETDPPATGINRPPTETDPLATGTNRPPTETNPPTETDPPAIGINNTEANPPINGGGIPAPTADKGGAGRKTRKRAADNLFDSLHDGFLPRSRRPAKQ